MSLPKSLNNLGRLVSIRCFHNSTISRSIATNTAVSKIRNIGIIAHIDAGKTTTTERMLFYSGVTSRIGNVDQGDTITDFLPQERERGITIQSAAVTIPWNGYKINLIDTPGHADFTFEVIRSLKVLDGAVTILDAVAGVESQTEKVWRQSQGIPKLIFINKMDREGASFGKTCKDVISKLGTRILLCNVPYYETVPGSREMKFSGVLDIVDKKLIRWDENEKISVEEISDAHRETVSKCRESLVETLGEIDEAVIDSFFETEDYMEVPSDILKTAIRKSTLQQYALPVFCGASFKNIGVQPLLEAAALYLPSPAERIPDVSGNTKVELVKDGNFVINGNDKLTVALAFKVITDPIRGLMVFVRVYSGKLTSNSTIYVNGSPIKIGKLLIMHADKPEEVSEIRAGNIGVIVNDNLKTGETVLSHTQKKKLQSKELSITVNPIAVPPPVFSISVEPKTTGDRRGVEEALGLLMKEDPSLKYANDEETGQIVLSGMGELHLEIAVDRLRHLKAKFEVGRVMVSYKETILGSLSAEKTITEDSNEINVAMSMDVNPKEAKQLPKGRQYFDLGDNNFLHVAYEPNWWENKKVMPYQTLINAVTSGCVGSVQRGPIFQLPLNSTLISLDSIEIPDDFQNASRIIQYVRMTLMEIIKQRDFFSVMEPMMNVTMAVHHEDLGSVIQDLTSARKGEISSIDEDDTSGESAIKMLKFKEISESQYVPKEEAHESSVKGKYTGLNNQSVVHAVVPLKEMIGYLPSLRKLTKGRATFDMEFNGMQNITRDRLDEVEKELQIF
ncbi:hypothetical protein WICPIJ_009335 [Wickerhamomyces pijperi]|uniref:Ribosome-releasing factor 2, mitochondrial n=1 Tax=Wickerhamomyces pijperi TaxID=599730 RepID=A0A9P8PNN9_WICPI|nr:hypothetical protein WICPIJ_009335 [Wickerhamomyces pijperi]